MFQPLNTASFLQPIDQGVIKTFKFDYLRSTLGALLKVNNGRTTVNEFWKAIATKMPLISSKFHGNRSLGSM
jgi:hypothetical protein